MASSQLTYELVDEAPENKTNASPENSQLTYELVDEAPEEGAWSTASRYASQLGQGIGEKFTWSWNLANDLASKGLFGSPEDALSYIHSVKPGDLESERAKISQTQSEMEERVPSTRNISKYIERKTGLPLEAKTPGQRAVGTLGMLGSMSPGSLLERGVKSAVGAGTQLGAEELGVDPGISGLAGLIAGSGKELFELAKMGYGAFESGLNKLLKRGIGEKPEIPADEMTSLSGRVQKSEKKPEIGVKLQEYSGKGKLEGRVQPLSKGKEEFSSREELGQKVKDVEKFETNKKLSEEGMEIPAPVEIGSPPKEPVKTPEQLKLEEEELSKTHGEERRRLEEKQAERPIALRVNQLTARPMFRSTREGGERIKSAVIDADNASWERVNAAYRQSDPLLEAEVELIPTDVNHLRDIRERLSTIPDPGPVTKRFLQSLERVIEDWGTRPVSALEISNQMKEWRQLMKSPEFAHGDVSNVYRLATGPIERNMVTRLSPEAREAYETARGMYREHQDIFGTDSFIKKLTDTSERNFDEIYNSSQDIDRYSQVKRILDATQQGRVVADQFVQDVVSRRLDPFIKKGVIQDPRGFRQEVQNLRGILRPDELGRLNIEERRLLQQSSENRRELSTREERAQRYASEDLKQKQVEEVKAARAKTEKAEFQEKKASYEELKEKAKKQEAVIAARKKEIDTRLEGKYGTKKPESISDDIHSVSGLKDFKETVGKTAEGKDLIDRVNRHVSGNILGETSLEKLFDGSKVSKDKVALLTETIGIDNVNEIKRLSQISEKSRSWFKGLEVVEKDKQEIAKALEKEISQRKKFHGKLTKDQIDEYEKLEQFTKDGFWKLITGKPTINVASVAAGTIDFLRNAQKMRKLNKIIDSLPGQKFSDLSDRQIEQFYNRFASKITSLLTEPVEESF
jgi:hypothetical protein